jgi:archaellum component FlaD/FlaE
MKIDPENYDLRELRRIADERRADGRERAPEADDGSDGRAAERGPEGRDPDEWADDGRGGRREAPPNRRGRSRARRPEPGRDASRETPRRDGRSGALSRPRSGRTDHADAHERVVRADRIAEEFGLRRPAVESSRVARNGRGDEPSSADYAAYDGRGRYEGEYDGVEYDTREYDDERVGGDYDDLGYAAHDEGTADAGPDRSAARRSESPRRGDYPDDVGRFRFDHEVRDRPRGRARQGLASSQLEQLLIHETVAAGDSLRKPYLGAVPKEYAAERVVFDWLEFLVLKGGFKRTMDALRYYLTVDWITEDVEAELHDYLIGFSGNVADTEEFDVDDHHLSLLYVAQLNAMS